MDEILATCAMFAVRFELKPKGGSWKHPQLDESNMSLIVNPPKEKVFVDMVQGENGKVVAGRSKYGKDQDYPYAQWGICILTKSVSSFIVSEITYIPAINTSESMSQFKKINNQP